MTNTFQITVNEVISGISRAIYEVYGSTLSIYKEKEQYFDLPAVSIYCINYEKVKGRYDRYTNTFNVIINYFPDRTSIINNKRIEMFSEAEKLMDAISYIKLPASKLNSEGELEETTLLSRAQELSVEEQEDCMQISVTYTVRTRKQATDTVKMQDVIVDITNN